MVAKATTERFVLVAILFIGIMVAFLDRVNMSVLVASDVFLADMGIQGKPIQIGMLTSAFLAVYGLANMVLSPLGDYLGPRKAMLFCVGLWMASSFVGGTAGSFATMICARIILGIGQGFYYPMQSLLTLKWFPPQERGRANAVWSIGQSLAPALAMPFFSFIVGELGWRASFYVCIAFCFVPLYLLWRYTADTPRLHRRVNALELAYIEGGSAASPDGQAAPAATVWQRVKAFGGSLDYWLLVIWYAVLNIIFWGLVSWLPTYLKSVRGFTWSEMGWLASLPFIFSVITKGCAGWLADRTGRSAPLLVISMLLGAASIYFAATVQGKYAAAILLACAFGFTSMGTPVAWTLLQRLVPAGSITVAGGAMNGLSTGLAALSPVIIGYSITVTGDMANGLFMLVAAGALAALTSVMLVIKRY